VASVVRQRSATSAGQAGRRCGAVGSIVAMALTEAVAVAAAAATAVDDVVPAAGLKGVLVARHWDVGFGGKLARRWPA
jgi:hypothetical protein